MICKAKKKFDLSDHTEVELGCGLERDVHMHSHMARDIKEEVTVTYTWPGEFEEGKDG